MGQAGYRPGVSHVGESPEFQAWPRDGRPPAGVLACPSARQWEDDSWWGRVSRGTSGRPSSAHCASWDDPARLGGWAWSPRLHLLRAVMALFFWQEVQSEAQREEASSRGEEGIPGPRARQVPHHRLRVQGAGGAAPGDRPQRVAGQQQCVGSWGGRGRRATGLEAVKVTAPGSLGVHRAPSAKGGLPMWSVAQVSSPS